MSSLACAPNRKRRLSGKLGRETCLTAREESEAVSSAGGAKGKLSDRELAKRIGERDVLRPQMPHEWERDPRTWLSNLDINAVMEQYARTLDNFTYLGTWPTDFAERVASGKCVTMCTPAPFRKAYETGCLAASVINLDVHTGKGTHWVAFALDCRGRGDPRMLYYDATGRPPPSRWNEKSAWAVVAACIPGRSLRRRVLRNAAYNRNVHQRQNTECGIFSMMFVDALIHGRSFEEHCSLALADQDAFKHRRVFFDFPDHLSEGESEGHRWTWAQLFGGSVVRRSRRRKA